MRDIRNIKLIAETTKGKRALMYKLINGKMSSVNVLQEHLKKLNIFYKFN